MITMPKISSVSLLMILGMAFSKAYGDMMEKDKMIGAKSST